jgi:hypothetical protein
MLGWDLTIAGGQPKTPDVASIVYGSVGLLIGTEISFYSRDFFHLTGLMIPAGDLLWF